MPGFLPRPGKDELLYNLVARYGVMTGQRVTGQLTQDFFGTSVGVTVIDLPRHSTAWRRACHPVTRFRPTA